MYRLLIVDDEPVIADGLFELFSELNGLDLDVCKAYSGSEALEWMNRTKIDIILTDICMPEMSGMQLLENIHSNWPQCKVIFLTGFDEFDYVYTAIRHEGVSYLLKSEGDEEIIKSVKKAITDMEEKHKEEELIIKARQQICMSTPLLQKEYLLDMLQDENLVDISQYRFDELEIPLNVNAPILLLMGHVDNLPRNKPSAERHQCFYAINAAVEQYLSAHARCIYVALGYRTLMWILQPSFPGDAEIGQYENNKQIVKKALIIRDTLEIIQAFCRKSLNVSINFVVNSKPFLWDKIAEKFAGLKLLLNYRIGSGNEMILTDEKIKPDESELEQFLGFENFATWEGIKSKKLGILDAYLESGQKEDFFDILSELTECFKKVKSKNYSPALEIYYSIALIFLSCINRWNMTEKIAFKIGLNNLTRIEEFETWNDAIEYLHKLAAIIFEIQGSEQEKRAIAVVNNIQKYIREHLDGDLSLVRLAEHVYLNPSYLSRLYKQATDTNLSEYINLERLKKAKEMLQDNSFRIHEIARAVGFGSAPYFTRFFKKMTNISPQEFRNSFANR